MILLIAFILLIGLGTVLRGASLSVFWDWFVSGDQAAFAGQAPDINFAQALGISLVVAFLTHQFTDDSSSEDSKDGAAVVAVAFVKMLFFYAIYWAIAILYKSFL